MLRLLLVLSLVSGSGADPMIGEILHLIRSLERRAAVATVTDSIAHRLANPATVINSIQRGTISVSTPDALGSATATITSVNTAKSMMAHLGLHPSAQASSIVKTSRAELTNATTVTAYAGASSSTSPVIVGYEVVAFK